MKKSQNQIDIEINQWSKELDLQTKYNNVLKQQKQQLAQLKKEIRNNLQKLTSDDLRDLRV